MRASLMSTAVGSLCLAVSSVRLCGMRLKPTKTQGMLAGEWVDDAQHGQGKAAYVDGSSYEGAWKAGLR